jgi:hypothetical protein
MKNLLFVIMYLFAVGIRAETLPPSGLLAKWSDLEALRFAEWRINSFRGWDVAGDGGSKGFFFETSAGERFDILAANPAYWNDGEKRLQKQVFHVIHKSRFYPIGSGSNEEKNVIAILTEARPRLTGKGRSDPKLLDDLISRIRDRKPMFKTKGEKPPN